MDILESKGSKQKLQLICRKMVVGGKKMLCGHGDLEEDLKR